MGYFASQNTVDTLAYNKRDNIEERENVEGMVANPKNDQEEDEATTQLNRELQAIKN